MFLFFYIFLTILFTAMLITDKEQGLLFMLLCYVVANVAKIFSELKRK